MAPSFTKGGFMNDLSIERNLLQEARRVSEICHGCRLCFNLCDVFPRLFEYTDEMEGELEKLEARAWMGLAGDCFECKLCYLKCPYTPPHHFNLDFPGLMQETKNLNAKKSGISLKDRIISNPAMMGKLGSFAPELFNGLTRAPSVRKLMELFTGIHSSRAVPTFHRETLERWMRKRRKSEGKPVVLFATCFVNYHKPETGKAAVTVLEKLGFSVEYPKQNCCGMPALDVGDVERARKWAKASVESLYPYARKGVPIVCPGPSCSLMLKMEAPHLLDGEEKAKVVSKATEDLMEFLARHKEKLKPYLRKGFGKISYHFPCHLRVQNIGAKSMEVLKILPETEVQLVEECSAMDGTWGLKKDHFEASLRLCGKLMDKLDGDQVATDCPLAGLQIKQKKGVSPRHPVEYLAYSLSSF